MVYRTEAPAHLRTTAPYDIFDCRLVLALSDFSKVLRAHDVDGCCSPRPTVRKDPAKAGGHAPRGRAGIDARRIRQKRQPALSKSGSTSSTTSTARSAGCPPAASARRRRRRRPPRRASCAQSSAKPPTSTCSPSILTPEYNREHRNHFHLEVTAGVGWYAGEMSTPPHLCDRARAAWEALPHARASTTKSPVPRHPRLPPRPRILVSRCSRGRLRRDHQQQPRPALVPLLALRRQQGLPEMLKTSVPIHLQDRAPVGRPLLPDDVQRTVDQRRRVMVVSMAGTGYGYMTPAKRVGFSVTASVEYRPDFVVAGDDIYVRGPGSTASSTGPTSRRATSRTR